MPLWEVDPAKCWGWGIHWALPAEDGALLLQQRNERLLVSEAAGLGLRVRGLSVQV